MDRDTPVLIAAYSGRALAASARRGGYAPLVADFFGDDDTLAISRAHVRLQSGLERGFDAEELDAAFARLSDGSAPVGFVCGTGFEDRTDVIARMAARWPLIGNTPEVIARVKDPEAFAALCRQCDVAHPQTTLSCPDDSRDWLVKRVGGAGGTHIVPLRDDAAPKTVPPLKGEGPPEGRGWGQTKSAQHSGSRAPTRPLRGHSSPRKGAEEGSGEVAPPDVDDRYYQRRVAGRPVSALVLADGHNAMVLGFSIQWASPTPRHPYRFAGAAQPAPLAAATAGAMTAAVRRLVAELSLVGLNSFDFLLDGARFHLLEVNPRPGATVDIFEPAEGSLFALHVAACRGGLPTAPPRFTSARAGAILYADKAIKTVPAIAWPDWTADRPAAGSYIHAHAPICTVTASASSAAMARRRVVARASRLRADLGGASA
jgi:predicted ATP-grasp superfamily ATP-dependent carboligase